MPCVSFIPLHSRDYLKQISSEKEVATDKGNSQNGTWQWTDDEIGATIRSWLWLQAQLMAW